MFWTKLMTRIRNFFVPPQPPVPSAEMHREVREAVHANRNLATQVMSESRRAAKASRLATDVAHEAIAQLERAKKERRIDARKQAGR